MKRRILWITFAITILSIVAIVVLCNSIYYSHNVEDVKKHLEVYIKSYDSTQGFTQQYAETLSQQLNGTRVTFIASDGTVVADSHDQSIIDTTHINRPEVVDAIESGSGFSVRTSDTVNENLAYYCEKQSDGSLVRISLLFDNSTGLFLKVLPTMLWFVLIDVAIVLTFSMLMVHFLLKPVEQLTHDATLYPHIDTVYPELQPMAEILNNMKLDISLKMEQLKSEKQLAESAQQSKDEFISNVTHEMNTPLTSIKGYAELIGQGKLSDEQVEKFTKQIVTQSDRLSNLISCIINYSKLDSDNQPYEKVSVTSAVNDAVSTLQPSAQARNITISVVAEDVTVSSTPDRVMQVVNNLIRNAIKYNKDNGNVTVKLVGGFKPSLTVSDSGVGISEENLPRIFDRFFTVDRSHNSKNAGFGLGLASVKRICYKQGWKLSVDSKVDVGTTFVVEF